MVRDYLEDIMPNVQRFVDSHYVGKFTYDEKGYVKWVNDINIEPIREYPFKVKGNVSSDGAVEIFEMPNKDRDGKAPLTGDVITNARSDFGNMSSEAKVSMNMNGDGAKSWARLTKENIGRQVAIVLDNFVYSYPVLLPASFDHKLSSLFGISLHFLPHGPQQRD